MSDPAADRVDLALAQRLAERAQSTAPWHLSPWPDGLVLNCRMGALVDSERGTFIFDSDAELIVFMRNNWSALVAELVGLREATDRIRRFAETEIANGYPMLFAEEVLAILDGDPK